MYQKMCGLRVVQCEGMKSRILNVPKNVWFKSGAYHVHYATLKEVINYRNVSTSVGSVYR